MDNELEKMLKDMLKDLISSKKTEFMKGIEKHLDKPCSISIEKDKNGKCDTKIAGTSTGILLTLACLEKTVLEKIDPPTGLWEIIKETVGTREVNDNE